MRRHEPHLEVEGLVAGRRRLDQLAGLAALVIGEVLAGVARDRVLHQRAVFVHPPANVVEGARVGRSVPVAPTGRDPVLVLVEVQVPADVHGPVPRVLEPDGQGVRVLEHQVPAAERPPVGDHPVVVRVLAGQRGGARRAAERKGRDGLLEPRALVADQGGRPRHHREGGERLVVCHQDHDVRPRKRGGGQHEQSHGRQAGKDDSAHRGRNTPDAGRLRHAGDGS
jgi:hypothetical protein